MNKQNYYQKYLEEISFQDLNNKKTLLLHSCCAVCSSWVVNELSQYFNLTLYFNNSNIYPIKEFDKRLNELIRFINESNLKVDIIQTNYDNKYQMSMFALASQREGEERCQYCIERRMEDAFKYGQNNKFDYVATVMSVSRNKNSLLINKIAEKLQAKYECKYLFSDFKKRDGVLKTNEKVKEYNIYRQNYCGCVYSFPRLPELTIAYLPKRDIFLFQDKKMFCLNTDTVLLGEYFHIEEGESVLDVGCNNGALMLYLANFPYSKLYGIDVITPAIEIAELNMKLNRVDNYQLFNKSIKDFKEKVDVIVTNPPYFAIKDSEQVNNKDLRNQAKHLTKEDQISFFKAIRDCLTPKGRVYLVYRYSLYKELEKLLNELGLYTKEYCLVYETKTKTYQSILVTLDFNKYTSVTKLDDLFLPINYNEVR